MAQFLSLFSGSSGNSTYVGNGKRGILIDAGRTAKQIAQALEGREIDPAGIGALLITHEHVDHASGVRVFASKYNVPVYATAGTIKGMRKKGFIDEKTPVKEMPPELYIEDMCISAFPTSHDTLEPCGFRVLTADERSFCICTDTGILTEESKEAMQGANLVVLESNHELSMLLNGPYPYPLKMRVSGAKGHLSNDDCARQAVKLIESGTAHLYLGHISRENNTPDIALAATQAALQIAGMKENFDYTLAALPPENTKKAVIF
ncbi:MAG: MBL fold metallo-hydrolase [Clostridia bacterium]|nr:MBL fold metallo-hydrolase [Clostridia bacterium]